MGADIIQQFVDWMENMAASRLSGAAVAIIAIGAVFVGIRLGQRLLGMIDDATGELPDDWNLRHGGYIDDDGIEHHEGGSVVGEYEDWLPRWREAVQEAIDAGDFQHADDLCNEHGFDKLDFEWH